jgi:acyl-CoA synthetase (AMP-forming)/AMP-acid ligase II
VIGVPDEVHGERVEAVVALREEFTEEELIACCR